MLFGNYREHVHFCTNIANSFRPGRGGGGGEVGELYFVCT